MRGKDRAKGRVGADLRIKGRDDPADLVWRDRETRDAGHFRAIHMIVRITTR